MTLMLWLTHKEIKWMMKDIWFHIKRFVNHNDTDVLLPVITSMINVSLSTGQFLALWKVALVKPLLKKSGVYQTNM